MTNRYDLFAEVLDWFKDQVGDDPGDTRALAEKIFDSKDAAQQFHDRMLKEGRCFELPYALIVAMGVDPIKAIGDLSGAAFLGGTLVGYEFAKALFIAGLLEITGDDNASTT